MRSLSGADKTTRLAYRQVFIPKDARFVLEHENGSACYIYEAAGKFLALAFWGTSAKPLFHYSYRTEAQRDARVQEFKTSVEHSVTYRTEARAKKAAWTNPLTVGEILHTCWGYDQTNVEFYAVTRVSGKRVWVREIAADYEETGYMSGKTWPAMPIRFIGEETMHIAQPCGEKGASVKINESATAWQGTTVHSTSSYA